MMKFEKFRAERANSRSCVQGQVYLPAGSVYIRIPANDFHPRAVAWVERLSECRNSPEFTVWILYAGRRMPIEKQVNSRNSRWAYALRQCVYSLPDEQVRNIPHEVSSREAGKLFAESMRQGRRKHSGCMGGEDVDVGIPATQGVRIGCVVYTTEGYWCHQSGFREELSF